MPPEGRVGGKPKNTFTSLVGASVISVLIPVGNSASYGFVLPATILVSWIGSMYLIYVILKVGRKVNKKLL